ncbi:group III truncated hemoglobin [Roseixanthobacter liquoris]|uniref:group III truncated hemoglobin n=1 Tax=Roseixanthobacter liquoris TaxID=3119921 RepID=UPI00372D143F
MAEEAARERIVSGESEQMLARRAAATRAIMAETGIDEAMIRTLVFTFYDRVRGDGLIGPIFAARVADWDEHLEKLCLFWSSVALMTGRYHGQPMPRHLPLPIGVAHFDRWLDLFEATAHELCPPAAATHFIVRARRIADSLEMGIASKNNEIATPRRRTPLS